MLKRTEIRRMTPPDDIANNASIKPCRYLIQNVDHYNFLIHKELNVDQQRSHESSTTFEYKGGVYLFAIANLPTEEQAVIAVYTYWRATDSLNRMFSPPQKKTYS